MDYKNVLVLFTWNVHNIEKSYHDALEYLSAKTNFIAVLQEVPQVKEPIVYNTKVLGRSPIRNMVLWSSSNILPEPNSELIYNDTPRGDEKHRAMGLRVIGPAGNLFVVAAHLFDWRNHPNNRITKFGRIGEWISRKWREGESIIVMGDMNSNPFDPCICSCEGLRAVRSMEEINIVNQNNDFDAEQVDTNNESELFWGRFLFNPMWKYLPEQGGLDKGTYRYRQKYHENGLLWHWFDQIVCSEDVACRIVDFRILTDLGAQKEIIKKRGRSTMFMNGNDHLPVQLSIEIKGG
jgi:exonuclease III